jgi:nucleoside phosphorylase
MFRLAAAIVLCMTIGCSGDRNPGGSSRTDPVDVAIVTVIPEEYHAMMAHMDRSWTAAVTGDRPNEFAWRRAELDRPDGRRPLQVVIALAGEAGTTSGGLAVLRTAQRWEPEIILLAGIAGGLPGKVERGDVVASEAVWGYEYGALGATFQPRHDWIFRSDEQLLNAARVQPQGWQQGIRTPAPAEGVAPRVVVGVTASGNKVIEQLASAFSQQITSAYPQIVSVEMEGAGAMAAAELLREGVIAPRILMLRGISDVPLVPQTLGEKADREKWKRYAADSVAAFTREFLRGHAPASVPDKPSEPGVDILFLSRNDHSTAALAGHLEDPATGESWVEGRIRSLPHGGTYRVAVQRLPADLDTATVEGILRRWRPRYVVVSDIALGLGPLEIGDVAVARMVWPFEIDRGTIDARRNESHRGSRALLNAVQGLPEHWLVDQDVPSPRIRLGAMAASAQAVDWDDDAMVAAISHLNGRTVVVDHESAIVAHAVSLRRSDGEDVDQLSIQGVHQIAGQPDSQPEQAATNAAALAVKLVRDAWPRPPANR